MIFEADKQSREARILPVVVLKRIGYSSPFQQLTGKFRSKMPTENAKKCPLTFIARSETQATRRFSCGLLGGWGSKVQQPLFRRLQLLYCTVQTVQGLLNSPHLKAKEIKKTSIHAYKCQSFTLMNVFTRLSFFFLAVVGGGGVTWLSSCDKWGFLLVFSNFIIFFHTDLHTCVLHMDTRHQKSQQDIFI